MSSPSARRALLPSVLANLLPIAILAALFVKLMIVGRVVSRGGLPPGGSPYFGTLGVCAAMALPLWRRALRSRLVVALILNALASIIALGDLWTFRWRGDVLSVS